MLTEAEQEAIDASVRLLEEKGPNLGFPHTLGIEGSRHAHMRELRVQHEGRPHRVLYAFDQRRYTILLVGGDKTGGNRWYDVHVPIADKLYDMHLAMLRKADRWLKNSPNCAPGCRRRGKPARKPCCSK